MDPLTLHPALTLAGILLALMLTMVWHELGHLGAALFLRVPVKLIAVGFGPTLARIPLASDVRLELRAVPMGMAIGVVGRRTPEGRARRPVSHDLAVAATGPFASFVLTGILLVVAMSAEMLLPEVRAGLILTAVLSAVVALLNLIPVPGLDGGHLALLTLALIGFQMTPQHEVAVHRTGMWVMMIGSLVLTVFLLLRKF